MEQRDKKTVYQFLNFLNSKRSSLNTSDIGSIDVAIEMLESVFGVSTNNSEDFKEFTYCASELNTIIETGLLATKSITYTQLVDNAEKNPKFQSFVDLVSKKGYFDGTEVDSVEYMQRYAKLITKFNEKMNTAPVEPSQEEKEALAEEKKVLGNTAISSKDYDGAVQYYTEALDLTPNGSNSHIYYSNRAAAYCHLNEYSEAVADCEASIALSPTYVKAVSRLGLANFFLARYEESVKAYERAVELEPDNEGSKKSLKQARKKLDEQRRSTSAASASKDTNLTSPSSVGVAGGGLGGMGDMMNDPSLAGMMNSPMMKSAMDKVGGQEGLATLMKDPQMMAMAQKMMQNPAAIQQAMAMLGGAGGAGAGAGGGMPDLSAMANMMGMLGGGAGAGGAAGGGKKKSPFKGFEDA